jgi:hypothetical protein
VWFGGVQKTFFCLSVNEAQESQNKFLSAVLLDSFTTSHATTASELYNSTILVPDNYSQSPTPTRISQDDYPSALLFLRQGTFPKTRPRSLPISIAALYSACLLTWPQVIGDLWERYLKLIDEGMPDG